MKRSKKRILSILAATTLTIGAVPQNVPLMKPVLTACAEASASDNFTYSINSDGTGVTITKWTGSDAVAVVPDMIEGLPVTEIGGWSFFNCATVTKVVLPDTITNIGNNAFNSCTALTEINIPNGMTSVGDSAFSGCSALNEIVIPNTVKSIGSNTFSGCKVLETVVIPESVTSIGGSAFRDTAWLNAEKEKDPLVIVNGILIDGTAASGDVTIPDSVISICDMAFSGCRTLTSVDIPDGVKNIGESAFYSCTSLDNINIPDSVESIGYQAFCSCTSLTEIIIPDSVTTINGSTFMMCEKLTAVKLPSGLTTIANSMFMNCRALTDVTIPDSVEKIEMRAFLGCSSLKEIVLPDVTESIAMQAFALCSNLKKVTVPDSVTDIGAQAFMLCNNVTIKAEPDSYAATYAQNNDISFKDINLPDAEFTNVSLTLSDDLGLNFFMDGIFSDEEAEKYRVTFSGECEEKDVPVSIQKKKELYCATANVSADHMDEKITAVLEFNNGENWAKLSEFTYSVNDYLKKVDTTGNEALAELVETTKKYGEVTKAYFNGGDMPDVSDSSEKYFVDDFKPVKGSNDMISLVLNSKLAARLYVEDMTDASTASYNSEELGAILGKNGKYYFEVTDITPTQLANDIVIQYGEVQYKFKPLSWSYLVRNKNDNGKNKAMADILYQYCISAENYKKTL